MIVGKLRIETKLVNDSDPVIAELAKEVHDAMYENPFLVECEKWYIKNELPKVQSDLESWIPEAEIQDNRIMRARRYLAKRNYREARELLLPAYEPSKSILEDFRLEVEALRTCYQYALKQEDYPGELLFLCLETKQAQENFRCYMIFHNALFKEYDFYELPQDTALKSKRDYSDSSITPEMIETAKHFPIDRLVNLNRSHKALCLWHEEKTPSMHYYADTNTVHCFGCGMSGDSIDVEMKLSARPFAETVRRLKS